MDKPISVGDLVMVVRPSPHRCKCAPGKSIGLIFRVREISRTASHCSACGTNWPEDLNAWMEGKYAVRAVSRLKRIPPLDELESLDYGHKLDVRQPA